MYNATMLHSAYQSRRSSLLSLLKTEKEDTKIIHLSLLSVDLAIQIFNDANRQFPRMEQNILLHSNSKIMFLKNRASDIKRIKKGLKILGESDPLAFERKMHESIALCTRKDEFILKEEASKILRENAFLFTHILYMLYSEEDQNKNFQMITAHLKFLFGLTAVDTFLSAKALYKEILNEREKYKHEDKIDNELETFILNVHHYCLGILIFVHTGVEKSEYSLEDAEKDLNEKINDILQQRKSNTVKGE
jgi:hypothetical protein